MSIFDNPLQAANWLRRCEHDKLRADTARYEASIPDETEYLMECNFCSEVYPEDDFYDGFCPECIKKVDSLVDGMDGPGWNVFINQPVKE